MKVLFKIFLTGVVLLCLSADAKEFLYILNDKCINDLYDSAQIFFNNTPVLIVRDTSGIILRFEIESPLQEYNLMNVRTYNNIQLLKEFLAKIENPVIIGVHTEKISQDSMCKLKSWEISTVIANKIEGYLLCGANKIDSSRIKSVGYGEFSPAKNTPYNGGIFLNRVDIMILCNVIGE